MNLRYKLDSNVGGFLGCSTSHCVSQIIYEKNQYYAGEDVKARIVVDNSESSADVKSIKFKLLRYYSGYNSEGTANIAHPEYIVYEKVEGGPAGQKFERELLLKIPVTEERTSM